MREQETSPNESQGVLTQHAMLVLWGAFASRIGLIETLEQVSLSQKRRDHRPQTKIIEFLLAILAGLPHLKDLSHAAHPLVKDQAVAEAWGQPGWADHSGVSRALQHLNDEETKAIINAVDFMHTAEVLLVGEETSGKPNFFGEVKRFVLPESGLIVSYPTRYFQLLDEDLPSLQPGLFTPMGFEEYLKGIDPAMEAILKN